MTMTTNQRRAVLDKAKKKGHSMQTFLNMGNGILHAHCRMCDRLLVVNQKYPEAVWGSAIITRCPHA